MLLPENIDESAIDRFESLLGEDEETIILSLGHDLIYSIAPPQAYFYADYYEKGLRLWQAFQSELYNLLCDAQEKKPKFWAAELIGGDIRNIGTGIIAAIASTYNVAVGIAVPAAALIVKKGLIAYCASPRAVETSETIQQVIADERKEIEETIAIMHKAVEEQLKKKEVTSTSDEEVTSKPKGV